MAEGLEVAQSDLLCHRNNLKHHTAQISTQRLIVRRGECFTIKLQFKPRGYLKGTDQITFTAETGPWPEEASGTKATFPLASSAKPKSWSAVVESNSPNSLLISIFIPGNAIIGHYTFKVHIFTKNTPIAYQLGQFVLLFNPWASEDDVYLADDKQRQEYVLNEYGFVYQGNVSWIVPRPWNFGQFEEDLLDICLKLLDKSLNFNQDSFKDLARRNDPAYVSRVVCAMINCNDDAGVLQGNWSGYYKLGVDPSAWNGSVTILRDWYTKDCQPVKFGQCWVFASVMCTVMRCLGIPSRVITNFNSAHDTNANLLVEEYVDSSGKKLRNKSNDSIWNFHVWTECWMERRDLSPGYGGWQVLDPTPQEKSSGIYCCGPASVKAVKEGNIDLGYDAPFVYSMVNADCISWIASSTRPEKCLRDTRTVGAYISTKCIGSKERADVTNNYKYPEGSQQERKVFEKAIAILKQPRRSTTEPSSERNGSANVENGSVSPAPSPTEKPDRDEPLPNRPLSDARISLKLKLTKSPLIGENIGLILEATNLDLNSKKVKINLCGQSMQHEGRPLNQFWKDSIYVALGPSEEKKVLVTIPYALYGKALDENNTVQVTAVGEENQGWKKFLVVKDITLEVPPVIINVLTQAVLKYPTIVEFILANPLPEPVTNCQLAVEGSGLLIKSIQIPVRPMKPREKIRLRAQIYPSKSGYRQLQANFRSDKFKDCIGYKDIMVTSYYKY